MQRGQACKRIRYYLGANGISIALYLAIGHDDQANREPIWIEETINWQRFIAADLEDFYQVAMTVNRRPSAPSTRQSSSSKDHPHSQWEYYIHLSQWVPQWWPYLYLVRSPTSPLPRYPMAVRHLLSCHRETSLCKPLRQPWSIWWAPIGYSLRVPNRTRIRSFRRGFECHR